MMVAFALGFMIGSVVCLSLARWLRDLDELESRS